jgi:hypothetical protein
LLVLGSSFGTIVAYFIFVTIACVALTVGAAFVLPRPSAGAYRMPTYPLPAIVLLALVALLETLLLIGQPRPALLGLLVTALGVPAYRPLAR